MLKKIKQHDIPLWLVWVVATIAALFISAFVYVDQTTAVKKVHTFDILSIPVLLALAWVVISKGTKPVKQ